MSIQRDPNFSYEPSKRNKIRDDQILNGLKLLGGSAVSSDLAAAANLRGTMVSSRLYWLQLAGLVEKVGHLYALPDAAKVLREKGVTDDSMAFGGDVTPPSDPAQPSSSGTSRTSNREMDVLDSFIAQLREVGMDQAQEVLRGLDPDFVKAVLTRLTDQMDDQSRKRVAVLAKKMEEDWAPGTDDELWNFILTETKLKIPRQQVCEGHCAPFDFLADCFFERGNPDKLAVGNRGSGKTQISGVLNGINVKFKRMYTSCTVGAVEAQAFRAYGYFKDIVLSHPKWSVMVKGKVLMGGTEFINGAKVEIVTGTITGVNSPHPVFAHWDEVELLRPGVFDEGLNMAQSKNGYQAMNVLTSSWKKPKGFVSDLIDEELKAKREGRNPPYQIYRWCVWETTAPCPHDCNDCPFSTDIKGSWADGSPRSFESACKQGSPEPGVGKLKFTDGFVPVMDAVVRFRKLPRRVWEAQQESKRPTLEGLVYDCFDEDLHTVEAWNANPEHGPVYVGIDFGGTAPHAAIFIQKLAVEVGHQGRRFSEGSYVLFDEVYVKDVGNVEFGRQINAKILLHQAAWPTFQVFGFFRDPAARAAAMDLWKLSAYGEGPEFNDIRTGSMGRVEVFSRIGHVYELVTKDLIYVDRIKCENFMNEIGGYDYNENTGKPNKEDDHLMDAWGYGMWNIHARGRKNQGPDEPARAASRPRAVRMHTHKNEGMWDPAALGAVPPYGDPDKEPDPMAPQVGIAPRRRDIGM